jgi:hypothetical protein
MWHFKKNEQDDDNVRTDSVWLYIPLIKNIFLKKGVFG